MDTGGLNNPKLGSDSQDSDDVPLPSTSGQERPLIKFSTKSPRPAKNVPLTPKGVEQAKKRLRAFSIQKKSSLSPVSVPKPISAGSATVFIGKATGVKPQVKPEPDPTADPKKPPKPPKPGTKQPQESYISTQKKTLAEIEDMKRKMELVELGIPLGLICPAPNSDKAMPTKAMPPIKTFLDPERVDELIREAKKARAEGREYKFDYRKLLPDYANPFQRKKDGAETKDTSDTHKSEDSRMRSRDRDKRRSDKSYDGRRHSHISHKSEKDRHREDKHKSKYNEKDVGRKEDKSKEADSKSKDKESKYKDRDDKSKDTDLKSKERDIKSIEKDSKKEKTKKDEKETDVDLKDFVVCDSWSDNEDKSKEPSPKTDEIKKPFKEKVQDKTPVPVDPLDQLRDKDKGSPQTKLERLNPVIDSFKFEIDPDDEEILDMFDESSTIDKFTKVKCKKEFESPDLHLFDYDDKDENFEGMTDDTFLESVINEIKQEEIDETSQDKALVEYDESPTKEVKGSVTPELDDRVRQLHSSRSDYSDGYKSTESGYKSTDSLKLSDYKSDSELERIVEARKRELERMVEERKIDKWTADSLETWSFVLKICQPLLFRHDRNKCYKETRTPPKLWYTENPKICNCVKDRRVVYEELEMCKMELVDSLYNNEKQEWATNESAARGWYPRAGQWPAGAGCAGAVPAASEWEADDSQPRATPRRPDLSLDKEYQRFMEAVWPDVAEPRSETPRSTPVRRDAKKDDVKDKKARTSEGWSQESDLEEDQEKSTMKKLKPEKLKRKRKHSTSTSATDSSESDAKKRKKMQKKKDSKKSKLKEAKRRRLAKKTAKKIKDKQKKKKKIIDIDEDSDIQELEKEKKKKDKKLKKKKLLKQKKKAQKKKKAKAKSSSSSDSSSDSEPEPERKSKKKKKNSEKKKKHAKSFDSQEELFDVNILKNIKTERETDEEISKQQQQMEFSPRRQKPREIINVKELQNDFVGNTVQIKKERELEESAAEESRQSVEVPTEDKKEDSLESHTSIVGEKEMPPVFKEQEERSTPQLPPEESNHSQCSSQESIYSLKDQPIYEKDESHLRPSSQNSNYSFHDVMASGMYNKSMEHAKQTMQDHDMQSHHDSKSDHDMSQESDSQILLRDVKVDVKSSEHDMSHGISRIEVQNRQHEILSREHEVLSREHEVLSREHEVLSRQIQSHTSEIQSHHDMESQDYEHGNYEMYEQMAMVYQSNVASQRTSPPDGSGARRIETVVRARTCGEIKCDWRAGDTAAAPAPPAPAARPSRWGLKPGEVNIVLTGGEQSPAPRAPPPHPPPPGPAPPGPAPPAPAPVYRIQSIANRTDNSNTGYDEAYMDMYGASDKLQYGDCFSTDERGAGPGAGLWAGPGQGAGPAGQGEGAPRLSSLDARINLALKTTVLGEVAQDLDEIDDKDGPEKGILLTKSERRASKRVSFADGYKPGQDSDVEEPPAKKRKRVVRTGCAWPCAASHADHVPLWDALPPPPPPPGDPPPTAPRRLLPPARPHPGLPGLAGLPGHPGLKFDPTPLPAFMPPEPPPGIISF